MNMEINYIRHITFLLFLFICDGVSEFNTSILNICPFYKKGLDLNVQDLVGSWMTVYTQPKAVDCFIFHVRATTDLEREQYTIRYGDFNGRVDWNSCLLQVETPLRRHYLQGNGTNSGLLENIIIVTDVNGEYALQNQSADQWMVFGRRGSEVLVIRDCSGETTAALARAPYWPTVLDLNAIFHRSGMPPLAPGRMLCEPSGLLQRHTQPHITSTMNAKKKYNDIL